MGAVSSLGTADSEGEEGESLEQEVGSDADGLAALDFCRLYDSKELRGILAAKDGAAGKKSTNDATARRRFVAEWLSERVKRNESTVSSAQFCQHVMNQSENQYTLEECQQFFARFDTDNDGLVPVGVFKALFSAFEEDTNALCISVSMLKKCPLMPSFLDAFAESKGLTGRHGKELLMFLLRNRPVEDMSVVPFTKTIDHIDSLRWNAVEAHIQALHEGSELEAIKAKGSGTSAEMLKQAKCYSNIEVSSNQVEMSKLFDGDVDSYWQSRGPVHSHWIQFRMRPGVFVRHLGIGVAERDASYMPQDVTVLGSATKNYQGVGVRELVKKTVPASMIGEFTLLDTAQSYYSYITIRIHRCRSDGHDTRIHFLNIRGVRTQVVEEKANLTDVTGAWILGLMGQTATATMHLVPHLRDNLMQRTTTAVNQMPPLSFSLSSRDRPAALTPKLLDELSQFVRALMRDPTGQTSHLGLTNFVKFSLARTGMATMLEAAVLLQEHGEMELPEMRPTLKLLGEAVTKLTKTNSSLLTMCVVSDRKVESSSKSQPLSVLVDPSPSVDDVVTLPDSSATLVFSHKNKKTFFLTEFFSSMPKNGASAKCALVFAIKDDVEEKTIVEKFAEDTWKEDEFNERLEALKSGKASVPLNGELLGGVQIGNSSETINFFEGRHLCRYVVVKLFEPMKENLSIKPFSLRGYIASAEDMIKIDTEEVERLCPLSSNVPVTGSQALLRVLVFLARLTQLQVLGMSKKVVYDLEGVTVLTWWKLYRVLIESESTPIMVLCRAFALHVFRRLLPHLVTKAKEAREADKDKPKPEEEAKPPAEALVQMLAGSTTPPKPSSQDIDNGFIELHDHLNSLVDDDSTSSDVLHVAEVVLVEGAEAFFPDAAARCTHILERIEDISQSDTPNKMSRVLSFESLCRYYSRTDSRSLLGLPDDMAKLDKKSVLQVLCKLLSVSYQKTVRALVDRKGLSKGESVDSKSPVRMTRELVVLLCALQRTMVTWVAKHLKVEGYVSLGKEDSSSEDKDSDKDKKKDAEKAETAEEKAAKKEQKEAVKGLLIDYTTELVKRCVTCFDTVMSMQHKRQGVRILETSIVGTAFRHLVMMLRLFSPLPQLRMELMHTLLPAVSALQHIAESIPKMFATPSSSTWAQSGEEVVLSSWEVESPHRYLNNQDIHKVFEAPGTTEYTVEFDSRCETERRYDYLEFTGGDGMVKRYDQKAGNSKWPLTVRFPGGGALRFHFHSDGSNVEWGYKFKVLAMGSADIFIPWMHDLQLGLAEVLGKLTCGCLRPLPAPLPKTPPGKKPDGASGEESAESVAAKKAAEAESEADELLVRLWGTVFRGGFMQRGKLQRSLSGQFVASPSDSKVNEFLRAVADVKDGKAAEFLARCRSTNKAPILGGEAVSSAVVAVFAALCWHSQSIREQINTFLEYDEGGDDELATGILQAFNAAESLRRPLIDKKQQLAIQSDDPQLSDEEKAAIDPEFPASSCRAKSLFLLKFSGLSKKHTDGDISGESSSRPKWLTRSNSWDRVYDRFKSEDQVKQMKAFVTGTHHAARSPLFRLVIDFVMNSCLTAPKVQEMLEARRDRAVEIAQAYLFAAEYVRIIGLQDRELQVASLMYLQNLLRDLQGVPKHYADGLDGCGLEVETRLRTAYYTLVRQLMSSITQAATSPDPRSRSAQARFGFIMCLLHMLDVQWEDYDFAFLIDINLPEFLMTTCKLSFEQLTLPEFEAKQLEQHKRYVQWLSEAVADWSRFKIFLEDADRMLFISCVSEELRNINVSCDFCGDSISPPRIRCLDCRDYDICMSCWSGLEEKKCPASSPGSVHRLNQMRWRCDSCRMLIVGTRIHCTECDDFDLCLACHYAGSKAESHDPSHVVTRDCTIVGRELTEEEQIDRRDPAKGGGGTNCHLMSYVHRHAWSLFTSATISLSQFLQDVNTAGGTAADVPYMDQAGLLLRRCVRLLTVAVVHISEGTKDAAAEAAAAAVAAAEAAARKKENKKEVAAASCDKFEGKSVMDAVLTQLLGSAGKESTNADEEQKSEGTSVPGDLAEQTAKEDTSDAITPGPEAATPDPEAATPDPEADRPGPDTPGGDQSPVEAVVPRALDRSVSEQSAEQRRKLAQLSVTFSLPERSSPDTGEEEREVVEASSLEVAAEMVVGDDGGDAESVGLLQAEVEEVLLDALSPDSSCSGSLSPSHEPSGLMTSVFTVPGDTDFDGRAPSKEDKDFAMACCEQVLGMLGTLLTPARISLWSGLEHVDEFEVFLRRELLPALFSLSSISVNGKSVVQNVSLALLGRLLGMLRPELCDDSMAGYKARLSESDALPSDTLELKSTGDGSSPGLATISFLFGLGANRMKCSDLEGASLIVDMLQNTCSAGAWREPTQICLSKCLEQLSIMSVNQTTDISAVFGISVLTGLPFVHRPGLLCTHVPQRKTKRKSAPVVEGEGRQVVILSYDAEEGEMQVADVETRLIATVKEEHILEEIRQSTVDSSCFPKLVSLLDKILPLAANYDLSSVESAVVVSLVLKAIASCLQSPVPNEDSASSSSKSPPDSGAAGDSGQVSESSSNASISTASGVEELVRMLIDRGLIRLLVQLAGKGTGLSNSWLLSHLELLCFTLFRPSETSSVTVGDTSSSTDTTADGKEKSTDKASPDTTSTAVAQEESAVLSATGGTGEEEGSPKEDAKAQEEEKEVAGSGDEGSAVGVKPSPVEEGKGEGEEVTEVVEEVDAVETSILASSGDDDDKDDKDDKDEKREDDKTKKSNNAAEKEVKDGDSDTIPGENPLSDLEEPERSMLLNINDAFGASKAPLSLLRAMFEKVNRDKALLLNAVQTSFDGDSLSFSQDVKEMAKKWEPRTKKAAPQISNEPNTDVGLRPFVQSDDGTSVKEAKLEVFEATASVELLIPSQDVEKEQGEWSSKIRTTTSRIMLKDELTARKSSPPSKSDMLKWQSAVAVLQARSVIGQVLSHWPANLSLVSHLFSPDQESSLYSLLDLLRNTLSWETFKKVLSAAVRRVDEVHLLPLCLSAGQCMLDNSVQHKVAESEHKYSNDLSDSGSVTLRGAMALHIAFDGRCSTESGCDVLTLASSADMAQNSREFHGHGRDAYPDFDMIGDTVYWKFTTDSSHTEWGWKFTVTGGGSGKFETGYSLLEALLSSDNLLQCLPYPQLCRTLVSVACIQTGNHRIKILGLLLKMFKQLSNLDMPVEKRPDLCGLRPLWVLYTKSLEKFTGDKVSTTVAPSLTLALTELFFVVENLVEAWGIADEFIIGMATTEGLHDILTKGICAVAYIGAAISVPNKATDIFVEEFAKAFKEAAEKANSKKKKKKKRSRRRYDSDGDSMENDSSSGGSDEESCSDGDSSSDAIGSPVVSEYDDVSDSTCGSSDSDY